MGGWVESSPDPSTADALSLRRRDIEARHSRNMPPEIGDDARFRLSIATGGGGGVIDDMSIFNARSLPRCFADGSRILFARINSSSDIVLNIFEYISK